MIRQFGPDGGPTANARADVAKQLEKMGRFAEARLLREEVVAANRRHRGDEHQLTLEAEEWLIVNLRDSGLLKEARSLCSQNREARLRKLGPDNEATVRVSRLLETIDKRSET